MLIKTEHGEFPVFKHITTHVLVSLFFYLIID